MNIDTRSVNGVTILDIHGKITMGEGSRGIRKKFVKPLRVA